MSVYCLQYIFRNPPISICLPKKQTNKIFSIQLISSWFSFFFCVEMLFSHFVIIVHFFLLKQIEIFLQQLSFKILFAFFFQFIKMSIIFIIIITIFPLFFVHHFIFLKPKSSSSSSSTNKVYQQQSNIINYSR